MQLEINKNKQNRKSKKELVYIPTNSEGNGVPTTRTPRIAGWWLAGSVEDAGLIGGPGADLVRPRCRSQLRVRRAVAAVRRTMRK